jgi:hypothetical protein
MNYKKWEIRAEQDDITDGQWLAKLMEEVGEAAEAWAFYNANRQDGRIGVEHGGTVKLLIELEHVEFVARCYRNAIRKRMNMKPEFGTEFRLKIKPEGHAQKTKTHGESA